MTTYIQMTRHRNTPHGFDWGSAKIDRCSHDGGSVTLRIRAPKAYLLVRITKQGRARVFRVRKHRSPSWRELK